MEKGKAVRENRRVEEPTDITQLAIRPKQPTMLKKQKLHPALAGWNDWNSQDSYLQEEGSSSSEWQDYNIFAVETDTNEFLNLKKKLNLHLF